MLGRVGLGVFALLAIVWMAVLVRDTRKFDHGTRAAPGGLAGLTRELRRPAELASRVDDLQASKFLNPGATADLQIAEFYEIRALPGDFERGLHVALTVTRREPQNLFAWVDVVRLERDRHDAAGIRDAFAHVRRLDPFIASP
jgi:hypothetical protein